MKKNKIHRSQLVEKESTKIDTCKTASKALADACKDNAFATKCVALQEHGLLALRRKASAELPSANTWLALGVFAVLLHISDHFL